MFYQTQTTRKPLSARISVAPSPPAATEWSALLADDVTCSVWRTAHALHGLPMGMTQHFFSFLSLMILTFDLDIQTRPSEGPNTSSL